jgi:hypothetical protein
VDDNGTTATISVKLEKEAVDSRTRGRRYTHEDQQIDAPGDLFFEYAAGIADKVFTWGTATVAPAYAGGVPGDGEGYEEYPQ